MSHFVYIIQSEKDGRYYVGSTHDVELRLRHHNEGWTKSTKSRIPWKLVYVEECAEKSMALKRERAIKKRKSRSHFVGNFKYRQNVSMKILKEGMSKNIILMFQDGVPTYSEFNWLTSYLTSNILVFIQTMQERFRWILSSVQMR